MVAKGFLLSLVSLAAVGCTTMNVADDRTSGGSALADRVRQVTRSTAWRPVTTVAMQFDTQHPQGMVKIGDMLFVSSVEITTPTKRFPQPQGGYDRDAGDGVGHLFKVDMKGNLLTDLKLGEGTIYHPGGIDYDGRYIWVPVAEYRPNSRSIVYRVDPGDDAGDRGVPLRRPHRRHRPQHRRARRCTA